MKTNAPEKIYLYTSDRAGEEYEAEWGDKPWGDSIEYTRTDAFIEKVSEWLKDCATFTNMNGKRCIDKEMYKTTFEDFKKYIKRE